MKETDYQSFYMKGSLLFVFYDADTSRLRYAAKPIIISNTAITVNTAIVAKLISSTGRFGIQPKGVSFATHSGRKFGSLPIKVTKNENPKYPQMTDVIFGSKPINRTAIPIITHNAGAYTRFAFSKYPRGSVPGSGSTATAEA